MTFGLERLSRRKLRVKRFFHAHHFSHERVSTHALVLDAVLTACEILTIEQAAPELVDTLLADFLDPELRRIDRHHAHEPLKLHFLFRAYSLSETRAGRTPVVQAAFEPRPAPKDEHERRHEHDATQQHDRPLIELAGAVFDIYAAVANALVNRRNDAELEKDLRHAIRTLHRGDWRIEREHRGSEFRRYCATHLLVLLAAGHAPQILKSLATGVHGRWRSGSELPDERMLARLGLWPSLHGSLLEDLSCATDEIRGMRIGAIEKASTLVSYARLIKPLSEADANAIFDAAIEVAGELDHEAVAQIRLLDELVNRGGSRFPNSRGTARKLSNVVSDAAIRLEGLDHFPWSHAMGALARLDVPLALANAARWHDKAIAPLHETMTPVLKRASAEGTIRPEQAAALSMLMDDGGDVIAGLVEQLEHTKHPSFPTLVEEAAYDVLIQHGHRGRRKLARCIEQYGVVGSWSTSLLRQERFVATLTQESVTNEEGASGTDAGADDAPMSHAWTREALTDSSKLQEAVEDLLDSVRAEQGFHRPSAIFDSARSAVRPPDRARHIAALAGMDGLPVIGEAVEVMLQAIDEWRASPSVREWCRTELPEVIVTRFPEMASYLEIGKDNLTPALQRTGLSESMVQNLLLRGLERHAEVLDSELIFKLAGMIGCKLSQSEAASLGNWYAGRLEKRIPTEYRDQTALESMLPREINEAVARFLFAYMGDCDLRLRWRAAHAIRRLARTGDAVTLAALLSEYGRREEQAFRGHEFYWLAARLWFVVAWDRVSAETPEIAACAGSMLLGIALNDSFPHLLVRSFARDACKKLVSAGYLALTSDEDSRLGRVNETSVPRVEAVPSVRETIGFRQWVGFAHGRENRRFEFDSVDTLPYWYAPLVESFAAVDGDRFLREAERWIVDDWGYSGRIRDWDKESRRIRLGHGNWSLVSHRHGSTPTLERLHTHLEWHAMWCAAGELLKTEPLIPPSDDYWSDLRDRMDRAKLVEPPLWSADLRVSTPLQARNWQPDKRPLGDWALGVREADHRAEIFPSDSPDYVAVAGSSERRTSDRIEGTHVSSALVEPVTGRSLLRALQTMGDSWDYKLPDEGEEHSEIDDAPFRFLGWLQHSEWDHGIDRKDPLRGYASHIRSRPGQRVTVASDLRRNVSDRPRWCGGETKQPMFVYETWGVPDRDDELYRGDFAVAGQRLLAHKEQLLNFLRGQELDLIIEVEVTRRERGIRRFVSEKGEATPEGRFARLYLLNSERNMEVAEGRVGAWTGDSPTA